jgi:hypothetical protein
MKTEDFDTAMEYLGVLYPQMEELSTGIRGKWQSVLQRYSSEAFMDAIEIYAEKFNFRPPTIDGLMEFVEQADKRHRLSVEQETADAFFKGKYQSHAPIDKMLAYHAISLCRALSEKQINSEQAAEYCREHLAKTDTANSGDYYAMAEALDSGMESLRVAREQAEVFRRKQIDEMTVSANRDSPRIMLENWLKQKKSN